MVRSSRCDDRAPRRSVPTRSETVRRGQRALPLRPCVSAVMLLIGLLVGRAQNYTIDWYKIAGGGGTSTGGTYSVSGTIGQPDAGGPMKGGTFSLTGGFWAIYAVQTAGAPQLYISQSGNTVTVSWQAAPGWTLEQNNNLANPGGWVISSYPITTLNGTNSVVISPPTGNLFFRLSNP